MTCASHVAVQAPVELPQCSHVSRVDLAGQAGMSTREQPERRYPSESSEVIFPL